MKNTLFLFLSFILFVTHAQEITKASPYANLVLEGGGVRGFAYTGAFEVLDSMGILSGVQRVGGSSAGAIQAMLLAVGYTPKEILKLASSLSLKKLNDGSWFLFGGTWRLKTQFGWYKGDEATRWIEQCIAEKTGDGNITFAQLHDQKSAKHFKDLYVLGADLTYQCARVLSHETLPDMRIKDAVRISMSIPLYYQPVLIDDRGKVYEEKVEGKQLHVMVDGGMLVNYPLSLFDSTKYLSSTDSVKNMFVENPFTLGLLLEDPEQVNHQRQYGRNAPMAIHDLNDFSKALYATMVDRPNPETFGHSKLRRTIVISHLGLSPKVRKLDAKVLDGLCESGREGVRTHFRQKGGAVDK